MVLYVHRNRTVYQGRGKNGTGNESPGPPPCSHSSQAQMLFSFLTPLMYCGRFPGGVLIKQQIRSSVFRRQHVVNGWFKQTSHTLPVLTGGDNMVGLPWRTTWPGHESVDLGQGGAMAVRALLAGRGRVGQAPSVLVPCTWHTKTSPVRRRSPHPHPRPGQPAASAGMHQPSAAPSIRSRAEQGFSNLTRNSREVRVALTDLYTSTLLPLGLYLSLYTGFTQTLHKLYLWVYCCPVSLPLPNPYLWFSCCPFPLALHNPTAALPAAIFHFRALPNPSAGCPAAPFHFHHLTLPLAVRLPLSISTT